MEYGDTMSMEHGHGWGMDMDGVVTEHGDTVSMGMDTDGARTRSMGNTRSMGHGRGVGMDAA